MQNPICQSCAMPMKEEQYGTEQNGAKTQEYCVYCYQNGKFSQEQMTLEQMIEICVPFMVEEGMTAEKAREILQHELPTLKRWRQ